MRPAPGVCARPVSADYPLYPSPASAGRRLRARRGTTSWTTYVSVYFLCRSHEKGGFRYRTSYTLPVNLVPPAGFEPTLSWLKARCATHYTTEALAPGARLERAFFPLTAENISIMLPWNVTTIYTPVRELPEQGA